METQQEERKMTTKNQSIAGQQADAFVGASTTIPPISPELMETLFASFMAQMMLQQQLQTPAMTAAPTPVP
jgi:hypothetical protein